MPVAQTGALSVRKSADVQSVAAEGDVVGYTVTATNTGNVTLSDVAITDPTVTAANAGCT